MVLSIIHPLLDIDISTKVKLNLTLKLLICKMEMLALARYLGKEYLLVAVLNTHWMR